MPRTKVTEQKGIRRTLPPKKLAKTAASHTLVPVSEESGNDSSSAYVPTSASSPSSPSSRSPSPAFSRRLKQGAKPRAQNEYEVNQSDKPLLVESDVEAKLGDDRDSDVGAPIQQDGRIFWNVESLLDHRGGRNGRKFLVVIFTVFNVILLYFNQQIRSLPFNLGQVGRFFSGAQQLGVSSNIYFKFSTHSQHRL
jgi:hypothetical protein